MSKIRMPADLVSGKGLPAFQKAAFLLCLYVVERRERRKQVLVSLLTGP